MEPVVEGVDLPSHNLVRLMGDEQVTRADVIMRPRTHAVTHARTQVIHTRPIVQMSLSALSYKTKSQPSDFTLFEPFSVDLWMAVLGALLAYAALLVILSGVLSRCSRRTPTKPLTDMVSSSYHTFSACVGGEDYEWISGPMRVLRLSLLTFVLVIGSTYTANLAAFFTAPSFTILGPTNSDEFKAAVVCTNSNMANRLAPFVKGTVVLPFPSEPSAGQNKNQCEWCSTSTQPSVRHLTPPSRKYQGWLGSTSRS